MIGKGVRFNAEKKQGLKMEIKKHKFDKFNKWGNT